ncbi:MAG: InlB B-repeat-containing protein [Clostridia bacterium]|nr:InlB B-repeat-containing protein [Clostridia bacterium]
MKINISKTIKKTSVLALSGLMVLSTGLGFMAMDKSGAAKAESTSEAQFLYSDYDTKGTWYPGTATSPETAEDRVYGTEGYFIPYMELVHDNVRQAPGQPVTDLELINDYTEESKVHTIALPSWMDKIEGNILSTRDFPHGYWLYHSNKDQETQDYILRGPDDVYYRGRNSMYEENEERVVCGQLSMEYIDYTFHLNDDNWHRVAIYMQTMQYDYVKNPSQSMTITLTDTYGNQLAQVFDEGYDNGTWYVFAVKGSFHFRVDRGEGSIRMGVGGFFFDDEYQNEDIGISNLTSEREGVKTINLAWERSSDDTIAMIYRKLNTEENWMYLATVNGTSYTDNATQPTCTYQYKVVPATKRLISGTKQGAYDVFAPDKGLLTEIATAPYDLTKIIFERESYVVPYGEELEAKVTVQRLIQGEYVPYPNVEIKFALAGGKSQYFVGTTPHPNMNLDLATVTTDENGQAAFSYLQPYAGEYEVVASLEAIDDPTIPDYGSAASTGTTVFMQLEQEGEKTPRIATISDAIKPGDTVTITGNNLMPNSDLQIAYAPSVDGNVKAFDENNEPYNCRYLSLQDMIVTDNTYETGLSFLFPKTEIAGTYDVWVKTTYGWSNGITLNAARPLYINQDGGYAGITVELVGRNFFLSDFGVGTREDAPSKIRVKLVRIGDIYGQYDGVAETRIVKVKTGVRVEAEKAVNGKDIEWTNPYKLSFEVPQVDNYGAYKIFVAADGICYKPLKQPQTLTIYPKKAQTWNETVFGPIEGNTHVGNDPLDLGFYWAQNLNYTNVATVAQNDAPGENWTTDPVLKTTDGKTLDAAMRELSERGGGVLYFPEGNYYLAGRNYISYDNIIWVGAGADKTNLYCVTKTGDGTWIKSEKSNVGFARINFELYEHSGGNPDTIISLSEQSSVGSNVDPNAKTVNKFITDCTMKFSTIAPIRHRALIMMGGKAYFLMQNIVYEGGNNPLYNSYSGYYSTMRNLVALKISGDNPIAPSMHATYAFVENVYLDMNRNGHALSLRSCGYVGASFVTRCGLGNSTNDGEMICFEPPGGVVGTGVVLSATERTFTMAIHGGEMVTADRYCNFNDYALYITEGKGAGQLRYFDRSPINEYGNEYRLRDGEADWDIMPDSTSNITVVTPMEGATVYRFEGNDSKKGIFLYSIMFDSVVAECSLENTEGIHVSSTDINQKGRFCPNIGVRIENNVLKGISPLSGKGGIMIRSERSGALESWGVQIMDVSIRGNTLVGVNSNVPEDYYPESSESPVQRGIVIVTGSTAYGQSAGDVRYITIEGNSVEDGEYGIYAENRLTGLVIRHNTVGKLEVPDKITYFVPEQMYASAVHTLYVNGTISNFSGEYVFGRELPTLADTATDVFLGWSLTEEYDSNLGVTTLAQGVNSKLYAVYGKQVVFNLNYEKTNGTPAGEFNVIKVVAGEIVEEQVAIYGNPFRVGYSFGGWYTDEACTTEFDSSKAITENQTVYAKWVSNTASKPNNPSTQKPSQNDQNGTIGLVIGLACGVVVLAGGGTALLLLKKKGKKSAKAKNTNDNQQAS